VGKGGSLAPFGFHIEQEKLWGGGRTEGLGEDEGGKVSKNGKVRGGLWRRDRQKMRVEH